MKTLIFDLDDTLLWDKKSVQEAMYLTCLDAQEKYGVDPHELEEKVRETARTLYSSYETFEFTKQIGINPFEGLWGDFTDKINVNFRKMKEIVPTYRQQVWTLALKSLEIDDATFGAVLGEAFPAYRRKCPFVYEDTFTVLNELKNNYQLVLLTNGSPTLQNEKLEMTPELVHYFDYIVVSGAYGRGKPDPSIFEHVVSLIDATKEEALMIGDNLNTDILGSNRIGMKNVWINRENMTAEEVIPTFTISSLSQLPELVQKLTR